MDIKSQLALVKRLSETGGAQKEMNNMLSNKRKRDLKQDDYNDKEWFKHFFDDLGTVAKIEDRERKQEI